MTYADQIRRVLRLQTIVVQPLILVSWPVSLAVNPHVHTGFSLRHGVFMLALLTLWGSMAATKRFALWRMCGFLFMLTSALAFRDEINQMGAAGAFWVVPVAVALCLGSTLFFATSLEYLASVASILAIMFWQQHPITPTAADRPLLLVLISAVLMLGLAINAIFIQVIRIAHGDKERYRRLSETDPLTGLANRRAFMSRMAAGMHASVRHDCHFVMLDVDDFKQVNDLYGHHVGDTLLMALGRQLDQLGDGCHVGRLGGEEFGAWFEGASTAQVSARLQAMLEQVSAIRAGEASIHFSAGVALRHAGDTTASLIQRADRALYLAKHSGKCRILLDSDGDLIAQAAERSAAS